MGGIVLCQEPEPLLFFEPFLLELLPFLLGQVLLEANVLWLDLENDLRVFYNVLIGAYGFVVLFEFLAYFHYPLVLVVYDFVLVLPELHELVELAVEDLLDLYDDVLHHRDLVPLCVVRK